MKFEDALQAIAHFFNDIIGILLPGGFLLIGLSIIHQNILSSISLDLTDPNGFLIFILVAISFICGQALLGIYTQCLEGFLKWLGLIQSKNVTKSLVNHQSYVIFKKIIEAKINANPLLNQTLPVWEFNDLRNMAMTITLEASAVGKRFMFISHLFSSIGTGILLLLLDYLIFTIFFSEKLALNIGQLMLELSIMFLLSIIFIREGDFFYKRSMLTPFSIATTKLLMEDKKVS